MHSRIPKVLHTILGKTIISFVVDLAEAVRSDEIIIVTGQDASRLRKIVGQKVNYAIQQKPLGSGDAALRGIELARGKEILILYGDVPLLAKDTLFELLEYHRKKNADATILTCVMKNPHGYGRIIRGKRDRILNIVEQSDATRKVQKIREINVGVYLANRALIVKALQRITASNRQGEYYLTDIVKELVSMKKKVIGLKTYDEQATMGINSKMDLAKAREIVKNKWYQHLMLKGVQIEDPLTTNIDLTVEFGQQVHVRPHTIIEGETKIKSGTTVGPFSWLINGKKQRIER